MQGNRLLLLFELSHHQISFLCLAIPGVFCPSPSFHLLLPLYVVIHHQHLSPSTADCPAPSLSLQHTVRVDTIGLVFVDTVHPVFGKRVTARTNRADVRSGAACQAGRSPCREEASSGNQADVVQYCAHPSSSEASAAAPCVKYQSMTQSASNVRDTLHKGEDQGSPITSKTGWRESSTFSKTIPATVEDIQDADQPEAVTITSDFHSISNIPVFDVRGPGIVDPEYLPSSVLC